MHAIYYLYNNTYTFSVGSLLKFIWLIWMSWFDRSVCVCSTNGTPLSSHHAVQSTHCAFEWWFLTFPLFARFGFVLYTHTEFFAAFLSVLLLFKQNDWMAGRQTMSMTNCFRQHVFGWQKKSKANKQTNTNLSMIYCIFNAAFEPFALYPVYWTFYKVSFSFASY